MGWGDLPGPTTPCTTTIPGWSSRLGSCGAPLCTAGAGWDGPTGLGTPRGVLAFAAPVEGLADPNLSPLMNALSNDITDSKGNKIIGLSPPCAMTGPYQGLSDTDKLSYSAQANDGCLQFVTTYTGP